MAGFHILVICLLQTLFFLPGNGHVSLTFPPARKYALDFLDNLRTPGPCGMPKGLGPLTTFKAGTKINVTWHLAYPHQGGYHLALLDQNDNVVYNFFTNFIGLQDPTTTRYEVTIPDMACNNCSLQLTRQAGEWRLATCDYIFWSCADINIIPSTSAAAFDKCNGQPVINTSGGGYTCQCVSRYHGDHCQYMDDCELNSDCSNHGLCEYMQATSYPKRQCYCDQGWFGQNCEHESVVRTTSVDKSLYVHTNLSAQFQMYHRVLETEQELEVLLEVQTETWVGLGLRPDGYRSGCQLFPIQYTGSSTGGTSEPEPEGTSKPEPEGTSKPEPEGTSKPEPEGTSPEPEGTSKPEPEGTSKPEPEGTSKPEPEGTSPEPEGTSKPEPEGTSKPEPEGTSPEPEVTAAPHMCSNSVTSGAHTLTWETMAGTNDIKFTHTATVPINRWMAFGISSDISMLGSDIYTSFINGSGHVYLLDSNTIGASSRTMPVIDLSSNVMHVSGAQNGDSKSVTFRRLRNTLDSKDIQLSETTQFHLLFADGPNFADMSGTVLYSKHTYRATTATFTIPKCETPTPEPEVTSKPEPEVTSKPEPEATSKPEPEGTSLEPEGTSKPEPEGTSPEPEGTSKPEPEVTAAPHMCSNSVTSGAHTLTWETMAGTNDIKFTHTATVPINRWMAFGISSDISMLGSDIYTSFINGTGHVYLLDSNTIGASSRTMPVVDLSSNVMHVSGAQNGDSKSVTFRRLRNTLDSKDIQLSETTQFHLLFADGPNFADMSGTVLYSKHTYRATTATFTIPKCETPTPEPEVTSKPEPEVTSKPEPEVTNAPSEHICQGTIMSANGVHTLKWEVTAGKNNIKFTHTATVSGDKVWAAFGISLDQSMVESDMYVSSIDSNGILHLLDSNTMGMSYKSRPYFDSNQNVMDISSSKTDSTQTVSFQRLRDTLDTKDIAITGNTRFRFLFAHGPNFMVDGNGAASYTYHTAREFSGEMMIPECVSPTTPEPEATPTPEPHVCRGHWNCDTCHQNISWEFNVDTDEIIFTMSADNLPDGHYFAAGISADKMMAGSDIFMVEPGSTITVSDRWATGHSQPLLDMVNNDLRTLDWSRVGTRTVIRFARTRTTNDQSSDWQFTDTSTFHILFSRGTFTPPHSASYHSERHISTATFKIEICAKPEPEPEPTGEPEGEPTGEPEGEPTGEPEPEGSCSGSTGPSGTSDTTGSGVVHPMDCTDMVIGTARGHRSHIGDYYSRDRSTPKRDVIYGGSESLTAAVGTEDNGVTRILYRRKLTVTERTDYEITNDFMHVIWAHGQEYPGYNHSPNSGLEAVSTTSDKQFYKVDELKYHGNIKRGTTRVNFLKKPVTNTSQSDSCMWSNGDHIVTWTYMPDVSAIRFSMTARVADNQYIALGLSADNNMPNTDVLAGWVVDGVAVMTDRWAAGRFMPVEDTNSITDVSGSRANGITVLNFTRPLTTPETTLDMQLSPDSCLNFFFALGGTFNLATRNIAYHDSTPIRQRFCIRCGSDVTGQMTTPAPATVPTGPQRRVTMQFRLQDVIWQNELSDTSSNAFRNLKSRVEASLIPLLQNIAGYVVFSVTKFTQGSVIVDSSVEVVGTEQQVTTDVNATMRTALSSGNIGDFAVDTSSIVISESQPVVATTMKPADVETPEDLPLPLIIILAFVGASVVLILLLGMCNCVRSHNKKHHPMEERRHLPEHLNGNGASNGSSLMTRSEYKLSGKGSEQRYQSWVQSTGGPNINPAYDSLIYDNMHMQATYVPQPQPVYMTRAPVTQNVYQHPSAMGHVVPQRKPASTPSQSAQPHPQQQQQPRPQSQKQQQQPRSNDTPKEQPEFRIETYVTDD